MQGRVQKSTLYGFTLVEIMLVFAVLVLLFTISYPANHQALYQGRKALAKSFLLEVSSQQSVYWQQHNQYAKSLAELGVELTEKIKPNYRVELLEFDLPSGQYGYRVSAIPLHPKEGVKNGELWVDHLGQTSSNWIY